MAITTTALGRTGLKVSRMGLAGAYGVPQEATVRAYERGVNYFFWAPNYDGMTRALQALIPQERRHLVITSGTSHRDSDGLRQDLEESLRLLSTDYIDVFHLYYIQTPQEIDQIFGEGGAFAGFQAAKAQGKVRALGITTHQRSIARQLAEDGRVDVLMLRYNCAHRGAESEVFPYLTQHNPGVVIYTALRWGQLLRRPTGWPEGKAVPTPVQCYRFVLGNPSVHLVLTAPRTWEQLEENLKAAEEGSTLSEEERRWLEEFGDVVHAQGGGFE